MKENILIEKIIKSGIIPFDSDFNQSRKIRKERGEWREGNRRWEVQGKSGVENERDRD